MDIQMPRRDGLSTAQAIRSGAGPNASTPIIALTADAATERRAFYERSGIDIVLTKPIESAALQAALATCASSPGGSSSDPPALDHQTLDEVRSVLGQAGLDELLDLLANELSARSHSLRNALADCDFARASAEAHSLKGAAANLGARDVAEAARLTELAIASASTGDRTRLAPALRRLALAVSDTQHALAALPRARPLALQA
jgi:CheY-like chemotaxis protein